MTLLYRREMKFIFARETFIFADGVDSKSRDNKLIKRVYLILKTFTSWNVDLVRNSNIKQEDNAKNTVIGNFTCTNRTDLLQMQIH